MNRDRPEYLAKKARFARMLTIFGRKPVLEVLQADEVRLERLHLSSRNKKAAILDEILYLAEKQGAEILEHSAQELSRISKNAKQDQGIAADIQCPNFQTLDQLIDRGSDKQRIMALDAVTNPQNLGMIIRSVTASQFDALIIPRKGCAALSPLVIKASAGTLIKAPIVQVDSLAETLLRLKGAGHQLVALRLDASESLFDQDSGGKQTYVLGNETEGVSSDISALCSSGLRIPMERGVESLNVAITAALICFGRSG